MKKVTMGLKGERTMPRYIKTDILAKIVFDKWQECDELKHIIPAIRRAIMCESTEDVRENVHARWIAVKVGNGDTRYTCSECGVSYQADSRDKWEFLFCPNCGAVMDERREDVEETD